MRHLLTLWPFARRTLGWTVRPCRIVGHDWFRRAVRSVEWIGDNTGRLRQVTTCGRCPATRELVY